MYDNGTIISRLVASKTRVLPVKRQSIPRLELLGSLILARLIDTILTSWSIKIDPVYWVDSMSVLFWIKNEKPWKQYVASRVKEIRRLTSREQWRHCPGPMNPADLPSRGLTRDKMLNNALWWEGPPFLCLPDSEWPGEVMSVMDESVNKELRKNPPSTTHVLAVNSGSIYKLDLILDVTRFSKLNLLFRVTARVFRFITNLKMQTANKTQSVDIGELSSEELNNAELYWLQYIQSQAFEQEYRYLRGDHSFSAPIYIRQFGLFIDDDGVLRCQGRINNSALGVYQKNPILLPSKHPFIDLLIKDYHMRVRHSGINDTLVALRDKYWILRGRQTVKRVVKTCVICRRMEGLPYSAQPPADLPVCHSLMIHHSHMLV